MRRRKAPRGELQRTFSCNYSRIVKGERRQAELPFRRPGSLVSEILGFADRPRDRGALIVGGATSRPVDLQADRRPGPARAPLQTRICTTSARLNQTVSRPPSDSFPTALSRCYSPSDEFWSNKAASQLYQAVIYKSTSKHPVLQQARPKPPQSAFL